MIDAEPVSGILDLIAGSLLILAALLTLAAAVGLLRFPDPLSRLHAATKPQILGLVLVVLAIALSTRSGAVLLMLIPVVALQLLTTPISAHMVGRAGYRTGHYDPRALVTDELEPDVDAAGHSELPGGAWRDEPSPPRRRRRSGTDPSGRTRPGS